MRSSAVGLFTSLLVFAPLLACSADAQGEDDSASSSNAVTEGQACTPRLDRGGKTVVNYLDASPVPVLVLEASTALKVGPYVDPSQQNGEVRGVRKVTLEAFLDARDVDCANGCVLENRSTTTRAPAARANEAELEMSGVPIYDRTGARIGLVGRPTHGRASTGNDIPGLALRRTAEPHDANLTAVTLALVLHESRCGAASPAVPTPARTCTVEDSDGFTHLRESGAAARVIASVATGTAVQVLDGAGARPRVALEGWVSAVNTSCGTRPSCGSAVTIADDAPATWGDASGTKLRASKELTSPERAVVANGAQVEVLEQSGSRLHVKLAGTVDATRCR
jgi:hypothetical protein